MAKTIVIPGSNFALNALDQVEFSNIPCTGITLSSNSLSFTTQDETKTLGYTLAPLDTTDSVSIISSNTDIITVSGNALKAVGIGSCTVTVTCGEISATCSITSSFAADFIAVGKLRTSHTSNISHRVGIFTESESWVTLGTNDPDRLQIGCNGSNGGSPFIISSSINLCPIIIPKNTAKIRVTAPQSVRMYWAFFNSEEATVLYESAPTSAITKAAKYAYSTMYVNSTVDIPFNDVSALGTAEVNTPGTDSIGITIYSTEYKNYDLGDLISGFTVEFIPVSES